MPIIFGVIVIGLVLVWITEKITSIKFAIHIALACFALGLLIVLIIYILKLGRSEKIQQIKSLEAERLEEEKRILNDRINSEILIIISQHINVLGRKYVSLVRKDSYGVIDISE